jgi:DNA repair exonuclease SbcCD ATPase subunit
MNRIGATLFLGLGLVAGGLVHAQQVTEIWKCQDERGRPLYTSDKRETVGKKCEVVSREVNVVPAPSGAKPGAKSPSPPGFPKESVNERMAAKAKQRETLEKELAQEEQMLAEAKRKLAEQEAIRTGDEKNYAKVLARLQPYRDAVEVHEKNVQALKRELANLYR